MVTALVTGGSGFIGSHIVDSLVKKGLNVKVLDSLIKGRKKTIQHLIDDKKVVFIEGDIKDRDSVDKSMKEVDYVFHTAGVHIQRSMESPEECIDANVKGSYNVFKSALDHGVKRVIFSSSSSVYGDPDTLPMTETSKINPTEPYGASKWMAEKLLEFLGTQGLKYNILRYFNVYGSRQTLHAYYTTVVTAFVNRILNNEPPIIDGKGDQSMDFTEVSDVVLGNILAMESNAENEIFNIGTGKSTSIKELAEIIIKALGKNIQPQFKDREVICTKRQADTKKAKELLGFTALVPVEQGLKQVAIEIRDNPELYK
jgi:UDP-glucose 4-epimerase